MQVKRIRNIDCNADVKRRIAGLRLKPIGTMVGGAYNIGSCCKHCDAHIRAARSPLSSSTWRYLSTFPSYYSFGVVTPDSELGGCLGGVLSISESGDNETSYQKDPVSTTRELPSFLLVIPLNNLKHGCLFLYKPPVPILDRHLLWHHCLPQIKIA